MQELRRRMVAASAAILAVVVVGTLVFYWLGQGQWSLFDCFYYTVITLTTVGYSEVLPNLPDVQFARAFTVCLIVVGVGTFLYFASTITVFIIEGDLRRALKETRMHKNINKLEDHIIVCGAGSTGRHVLSELELNGITAVLIDIDAALVENYRTQESKPYALLGDATDDHVLEKANIATAQGLVAALASDKDNLYLTLTARQFNQDMRIVARGTDLRVLEKLRKAGANTVVSPNYIGGLRMASEILHPKTVRFLDDMRRDQSDNRIDEVEIGEKSDFLGKSLKDLDFRRSTDLLVIAVRLADGTYTYNPGANFVLETAMTMVVLGPVHQVQGLRKQADSLS